MPLAELAAGHYEPDGAGDGRKYCVNVYPERHPADPARPNRLVTTPGSLLYSTGLSTSCRGIFYQEGFSTSLIVVDGTAVKLIAKDFGSAATMTGTLTGTDRAQMAASEAEIAFLSDGDIYLASSTSSFAAVTDVDFASLLSAHNQSAFTSIASLGQRLLFTYGSRFGFTAAGDFDDTTTLNFYTAESSPDPLVAGVVLGNTYYLFGTQTIEPWIQTGDDDDPFSPIAVDPLKRGCLCRDSIVQLDNTLMFIGDDRGVYRIDGSSPTRLDANDAWVSRYLEGVDADDIICSKDEIDGHSFYFINTPNKCIVYDIATGSFHLRQTYQTDGWEWAFQARAGAIHFAGSRTGARLAKLSRDYQWDRLASASGTGTARVMKFSAHLPTLTGRKPISSVRLDGAKGVGLTLGQGSDPEITMSVSKDRGATFGPSRNRKLGATGEYNYKTVWFRCGRSEPEQTVFLFEMSDPVKAHFNNVAVNEGR